MSSLCVAHAPLESLSGRDHRHILPYLAIHVILNNIINPNTIFLSEDNFQYMCSVIQDSHHDQHTYRMLECAELI